jgi:cytochrome c-type biogenesis protein CcmF
MNEIGFYSIFIAFLLSGYSGLTAVVGAKGRRGELITSAENAVMAVFVFLTLAAAAMVYALLTRDFQVEYVWSYSSRSLSWFYTLTAFYAGQKGSLLLWAWLLSIFTVIVVFQNRRKNRELMPYVIGVLMLITFFFTVLMVFSTNPFELFDGRPVDGRGLNPLLQNPGMIFHPPTLYLGYVGFTVPFAFSIAALITGRLEDVWIKTTRRWAIFSWFFLTVGNLFGMEWAYVELGWGGYWAWDPVENASFMPWIMGTAYLHSVMIQEKRGMLKVWNLVLILLTFLLTIFGTFITRSGVIASVHSFGESTLGWIFLIFLIVVLTASLLLLVYRLPHLKSRNQLDSLLSRESTFLYNNLLFVGIAFTVFWGTLFPIISEAVRGVKMTVGPPFFNAVITPVGLALLFLTGLCPLVGWRRSSLMKFTKKFLYPFLLSLVGAVVLLLSGIRSLYPLITFTLCIFVVVVLFAEFLNGTRARHALSGEGYLTAFWNLFARNKRRYGGYVIHFGIILIFMGIGGSAFNTEKQITLNKGESSSIKDYTLRYEALSNYPSAQKDRVVATLTLFNDNHKVGILSPEKSLYKGQGQPTTEVAIHSTLKEDLYVILAGHDKDTATFKILLNPLVIWLWIGGGIMALGTVIVMLPNRRKKSETEHP